MNEFLATSLVKNSRSFTDIRLTMEFSFTPGAQPCFFVLSRKARNLPVFVTDFVVLSASGRKLGGQVQAVFTLSPVYASGFYCLSYRYKCLFLPGALRPEVNAEKIP